MSLYPQNVYGQPYGGSSYSSAQGSSSYSAYYQQPPPPPPPQPPAHVYYDSASFRRTFASRLAELTFNSRPIIQNLSMYAQEYSQYARIVGECLEAHIRRVPPWMKLPAFYLLDAISKNVYEPYARQFSSFVVPLYLETYPQVDDNTKGKMEEMLLTWRHGAPDGNTLFGPQQQAALERGVWPPASSSSSGYNRHSGPGSITKAQVLTELQFARGQKERAFAQSPYDATLRGQIEVMDQLRHHVEAGVSQGELRQILTQLRTLMKTAPPPAAAPQAPIQAPPPVSWQPEPQYPPNAVYSHPTSAPVPVPVKRENLAARTVVPPVVAIAPVVPAPIVPVAQAPPAPSLPAVPSHELSSLLTTLLNAGVVRDSATPPTAASTVKERGASAEAQKTPDISSESIREYRDAILAQDIDFNNLETVEPTALIDFLYDRQSLQCRQCGIRFPDTVLGKKNQNDHLDMHFRQNRKANDDIGRGHSRSWFVALDDWLQDSSTDEKGGHPVYGSGSRNNKAAVAAETAKRDAELRAQFVIVPPGEEALTISCPICKEVLKSEFLEDDEDWVWKNAMKKDDKIYHATCFAEAITSTSSLAAKLRTETGHGSRSATPEVQPIPDVLASARGTPPPSATIKGSDSRSASLSPLRDASSNVAGIKRKVEHSDSDLPQEATGTPPFKKVALSASS